MTDETPRPMPPIPGLPAGVRLGLDFDPDCLAADLAALRNHTWQLQRIFDTDGVGLESKADWRCLSLRSPGGDPARTDPGGPGLVEFADTPWLARAPYLAEVLAALPGPLRSARLMALGPGATSHEHFDNKYGPQWGVARLHVPVTTSPGARMYLDGTLYQWQPGALWFGDFSRLHRVQNTGTQPRVHLVVDAAVTPALLALFPAALRERLNPDDFLFAAAAQPLPADADRYRCRFDLPESFADWEEPEGRFRQPQPTRPASVEQVDGELVLALAEAPAFRLVHIGDGEFRFAGWTDERTVQILPDRSAPRVVLRTRRGPVQHERAVDARPLAVAA